MNKRHYEHTLPNIRGSLSNTYEQTAITIRDDSHPAFKRELTRMFHHQIK